MSVGNAHACALAEIAPNTDGPRQIPAITSPITYGWPTFTATQPKMRQTIRTIAAARKNAATVLLKSARCSVAVNFSPAGDRPDGVVSAGFGRLAVDGTGVATCSGMIVTLVRLRSFAVAVMRAVPPLAQAMSPATAPVVSE